MARVVTALEDAGIREQTTLFVVADHGFTLHAESDLSESLQRQEGCSKVDGAGKTSEARANVFPEGGMGLVYCNDPGTVETDRSRVKELFTGREGVVEVLEPCRITSTGCRTARIRRIVDLVLVLRRRLRGERRRSGDAWVEQAKVKLAGSHGFWPQLADERLAWSPAAAFGRLSA